MEVRIKQRTSTWKIGRFLSYRIWKKENEYNGLGEIILASDNESNYVTTHYYSSGRVKEKRINGSTQNKVQLFYDDNGNQTKSIDPNSGETNNVYNAFSQLVSTVHNEGAKREFEYFFDFQPFFWYGQGMPCPYS